MEWIILLAFAFFDYIGYNTIGQRHLVLYRILQTILQITLTWNAVAFAGWFAAIAWLWLWWGGWADLFYYMFYDWLRFFGYRNDGFGKSVVGGNGSAIYTERFAPMTAFEAEVLGGLVTWFWWTLLGLVKWAATGERQSPMSAVEICMQAFAMLAIYGIARWLIIVFG
jgi:hypothetical protein